MDGSEKEKTTTVGQYDADEIIKQAKHWFIMTGGALGLQPQSARGDSDRVTTRAALREIETFLATLYCQLDQLTVGR